MERRGSSTKTAAALALLALLVAAVALVQGRAAGLARQLAHERGAFAAKTAELQALLERAEARPPILPASSAAAPCPAPLPPRELIARVQRLSGDASATLQQAVYWLEELARRGPPALPAIRDFLAAQEDRDLDLGWLERGRGWRDRLPGDFVAPPALRLGLFDVVRRIGGSEAEDLLAVMLTTTRRGVELAYLTRLLHQTAPGRYREPALASARDLLAQGGAGAPPSPGPLDRNHRDHLYSVLAFYGDPAYVGQAQAQLVSAGGVDRAALEYLHRALGPQVVTLAARAYQDQRLADPAKREPLARLALEYVGSDPAATELWQKAIGDPATPKNQRQDLIEDLNEKGFPDPKNLGTRDLPLIESRIALVEKLAPAATDPVNADAFKEAYKDLLEMRRQLQAPR
jgi:hypothetical protein